MTNAFDNTPKIRLPMRVSATSRASQCVQTMKRCPSYRHQVCCTAVSLSGRQAFTKVIRKRATQIVPPNKKVCRRYITWTSSKGELLAARTNVPVSTARLSSWLTFQEDGNLHYGGNPLRAMWSSGTHNKGANRIAFQKDGNVVIYRGTRALWSTGTWERNRPRTNGSHSAFRTAMARLTRPRSS